MIRFIDLTSNLTGKRIIFALDDIANVTPSAGPTVGAWINSKTAGIPGVLVRESSDEIMRRIERWGVDSDQSYYNVRRHELIKPKADTAEVPFADESRDRARHVLEPIPHDEPYLAPSYAAAVLLTKGQYYYLPEWRGYTTTLREAGRYDRAVAQRHAAKTPGVEVIELPPMSGVGNSP